jgi:hypothetical protein
VEGATGLAVWLVIALVLVGLELATMALVALHLTARVVGAGIAAVAGASFPGVRDPRTSSRWPRERRSSSRRSTVSHS